MIDKNKLKEQVNTNAKAVIEELKIKVLKSSSIYDDILTQEGRITDIENPEKLYDILSVAIEKEGGEKDKIQREILEFHAREKNKIRHALFSIINRISDKDLTN